MTLAEAEALYQQAKFEEATHAFATLIAEDELAALPRFRLGQIHFRTRSFPEAAKVWTELYHVLDGHPGQLAQEIDRLGPDVVTVEGVLPFATSYPPQAQVCCLIGDAYLGLEDWNRGLVSYANALHISPNCWAAIKGQAQCHIKMREYDRARRELLDYLEENPRDAKAYRLLAMVARANGWFDQQMSLLHCALLVEPGHLKSLDSVSRFLEQRGRYAEAMRLYREAIERNGESVELLNNVARLELARSRQNPTDIAPVRGAIVFLEKSLSLDPNQTQMQLMLANLRDVYSLQVNQTLNDMPQAESMVAARAPGVEPTSTSYTSPVHPQPAAAPAPAQPTSTGAQFRPLSVEAAPLSAAPPTVAPPPPPPDAVVSAGLPGPAAEGALPESLEPLPPSAEPAPMSMGIGPLEATAQVSLAGKPLSPALANALSIGLAESISLIPEWNRAPDPRLQMVEDENIEPVSMGLEKPLNPEALASLIQAAARSSTRPDEPAAAAPLVAPAPAQPPAPAPARRGGISPDMKADLARMVAEAAASQSVEPGGYGLGAPKPGVAPRPAAAAPPSTKPPSTATTVGVGAGSRPALKPFNVPTVRPPSAAGSGTAAVPAPPAIPPPPGSPPPASGGMGSRLAARLAGSGGLAAKPPPAAGAFAAQPFTAPPADQPRVDPSRIRAPIKRAALGRRGCKSELLSAQQLRARAGRP